MTIIAIRFITFTCRRGLPSKDPEEELKHKLEYEAMVEAAKKKGQYWIILQIKDWNLCPCVWNSMVGDADKWDAPCTEKSCTLDQWGLGLV